MNAKTHILVLAIALTVVVLAGCSTAKNTSSSRWWHAFNARYNTYFNGAQAYIDGSLEKENGNQDNFTEMIPLYTVGNEQSREIGKSNFDRAILKAQKAIKQHSIKRRPQWNKSRRKTVRDIEWLNRREYNPFLWKAWMLMGRSQFYEGDFDAAASTFAYMSRLYETQPAIYGRARAWLAKSYIENGFLYDAEDVIRNMRRDSMHWRARKEWDYTMADYYIHTAAYDSAVPYLRRVISHEMRRKQKAREWFLLGQLYKAIGSNGEAYKAFRRTVRMNPPYQLEFNARIAQTEVLAAGQSKKMIKLLKRMARSDKNKEYLDQVYYAIGNIYLAQKDTANAIDSYEQGNKKATRSGIEKGVLLLRLGDLYWQKEKFSDAGRCYGEAIGLLDKDRPDYEQLSNRSKVLDELVPYTEAVHLQDSLQELSTMDEAKRNEAIDRVIEALKKKEKEERKAQAEQEASQAQQNNQGNQTGMSNNRRQSQQRRPVASQQSKEWYFYNQMAVMQGKQQFQKLWGKRENVDDWQRNNKTVVAGMGTDDMELTDEQRDSLFKAQATADSLEQISDSAQNDPHRREYYLAQIPFTPEQKQASDVIIMDGLYHSGVIFKDKLDNLPLSEKALRRLVDHYPSYENKADAFYHLFLLYSRKGEPLVAESYVDSLRKGYPESQWTVLLTDPNFVRNAREGVHLEDSLYAATYDAFKADRYNEVRTNTQLSAERFPLGANRDKFMFIGALGKLNDGDSEGCLSDLDSLVAHYPTSKLSELAGMIINGVKAGRKLRGGRFDIGNVWQRRSIEVTDSAQMKQKQLSNERNTPFVFMLAYQPDSVDENKLLYQLARYNFTSYLVRDFEIAIDDADGLHRMTVSGFLNYDEALQYARQLLRQPQLVRLIGKARPVIISQENLPMLGSAYSYDDYSKFYNKHFAPLKISTFHLLTEPAEVVTEPEPEPTETDVDNFLEDTFQGAETPSTEVTIPIAEPETQEPESGVTVPATEPEKAESQGVTVPLNEPEPSTKPETGTPVIIEEEPEPEPKREPEVEKPVEPEVEKPVEPEAEKPVKPEVEKSVETEAEPVPVKPEEPKPEPKKNENADETVSPFQQDGITIPMEEEGDNGGNDFIIDDEETPAQQPAAREKRAGQRPAANKEKTVKAKPKTEPAAKTAAPKAEPKQQLEPENFDLEDEYYDLEGF